MARHPRHRRGDRHPEVVFTQALDTEGLWPAVEARQADRARRGDDSDEEPILLAMSDNDPRCAPARPESSSPSCIASRFGRPGTPTDQAWIETLFGHVKTEWPHLEKITLRAEPTSPDTTTTPAACTPPSASTPDDARRAHPPGPPRRSPASPASPTIATTNPTTNTPAQCGVIKPPKTDIYSEAPHAGLSRCPSGRFPANGAWLACCVLAHNLARWTARLGRAHPTAQLTVADHPQPAPHRARPPRQPQRPPQTAPAAQLAMGKHLHHRPGTHPQPAPAHLSRPQRPAQRSRTPPATNPHQPRTPVLHAPKRAGPHTRTSPTATRPQPPIPQTRLDSG